jgi:hypothetical protein
MIAVLHLKPESLCYSDKAKDYYIYIKQNFCHSDEESPQIDRHNNCKTIIK